MPNSFARVKEVFEQWSMYDAVVQAGYMAHAELVATLADWAQQQTTPLKIIDLGCGDGWLATHAFRHANVAEYHAVDVSEAAVAQARQHVAVWQGRAMVTAGNLAEFLGDVNDNSANVILASYSLHHFSTEAKIALIADIHRVLAPGGTLLWIDAVRHNDESRDEYIRRLTHEMETDWTALTPDQREKACAHVRESDFPETSNWMLEHVRAAGFPNAQTLLSTPFFQGWAFSKPA
jgi:ubiquinone/menaquinone biosynthesis C-methylase UbiE